MVKRGRDEGGRGRGDGFTMRNSEYTLTAHLEYTKISALKRREGGEGGKKKKKAVRRGKHVG
jgi:hypothetical protein